MIRVQCLYIVAAGNTKLLLSTKVYSCSHQEPVYADVRTNSSIKFNTDLELHADKVEYAELTFREEPQGVSQILQVIIVA